MLGQNERATLSVIPGFSVCVCFCEGTLFSWSIGNIKAGQLFRGTPLTRVFGLNPEGRFGEPIATPGPLFSIMTVSQNGVRMPCLVGTVCNQHKTLAIH